MSPADRLWVYGLARAGRARRIRAGGRNLQALRVGDVDVIVERRTHPPAATAEALAEQHTLVAGLAARVDALLPARFGALLSESEIRAVVTERQQGILDALDLVRGRRQMTVRVFGDPDREAVRAIDRASGTAFLESLRARARYVPPDVRTLRAAAGSLACAERVEAGTGRLRVTVFHLVHREAIGRYRAAVESAAPRLAPHRLAITGPWPAFAFAPDLVHDKAVRPRAK